MGRKQKPPNQLHNWAENLQAGLGRPPGKNLSVSGFHDPPCFLLPVAQCQTMLTAGSGQPSTSPCHSVLVSTHRWKRTWEAVCLSTAGRCSPPATQSLNAKTAIKSGIIGSCPCLSGKAPVHIGAGRQAWEAPGHRNLSGQN